MKWILLAFVCVPLWAQTQPTQELSFEEYLGFVKKYHPRVKSAQLQLSAAQANLMKARGAFDPKIEVDFNQKKFQDKTYYGLLNSSFKIPTWYGIEVKAGFENNDGYYLNPQLNTPEQGLYAVGVTVPVGQGLWINERMADLKKAKIQLKLSKAEQTLDALSVVYESALAYFAWKKNYQEVVLYRSYLQNAQKRYTAISTLIREGDKPAIDSVEAGITVRSRQLNLAEAQLKLTKSKFELANYLWIENAIPLELQDTMIPELALETTIATTLETQQLFAPDWRLDAHPKITALSTKLALLELDRKLKANALLPKADLGYQYLTPTTPTYSPLANNYKLGVSVNFPLFLRKERGSLKLAQFKVQDAQWDIALESAQLSNKIKAQQADLSTRNTQKNSAKALVQSYQQLLDAEDRLFGLGESSFFLLNTRENNLVGAQLQAIQLENLYFQSHAELYKLAALPNR